MPEEKQSEDYSHSADSELDDLRRELAEERRKNTELQGTIEVLTEKKNRSGSFDGSTNALERYIKTLKSDVTQLEQLYENTDRYRDQIWKIVDNILSVKSEVKNIEINTDDRGVRKCLRDLNNFIEKRYKSIRMIDISKISERNGKMSIPILDSAASILSGYLIYNASSGNLPAFVGGAMATFIILAIPTYGIGEISTKYFLKRSSKQKIYDILEESEHALDYLKKLY